ncbi:hypothetical protein ACRAWF_28180 [Streptomyces sp. L7]
MSPDRALLTIGAQVLTALEEPSTVSGLWHSVRRGKSSERKFISANV